MSRASGTGTPMKRIFLVAYTKRKKEVGPVLRALLPWLRSVAQVVGIDREDGKDLGKVDADLMVVFGGDGTMLSVARRMKGNPVPVLGVNMGVLGFMAEVSHEDLKQILPGVLAGRGIVSPRMMLQATIVGGGRGQKDRAFIALNDAVLLRLPKAAMMSVGVSVSGEFVARYKGDGLIVSTATGSTGYSLSAGGPILSERLKGFIVVPVCAHTLASRPIVLSGEEQLEIEAETRSGSPVELVMDGQVSVSLKSGTRVRIQKAPYEFNIVSLGLKGRFEIIRDKLHWAGWLKEGRG
ncbi:MAG: NAD(+)/NADH kinase [Planctomycetota bacterium]|nr:NAD(+)/NADH kinase [Planctomycetota bacterium]